MPEARSLVRVGGHHSMAARAWDYDLEEPTSLPIRNRHGGGLDEPENGDVFAVEETDRGYAVETRYHKRRFEDPEVGNKLNFNKTPKGAVSSAPEPTWMHSNFHWTRQLFETAASWLDVHFVSSWAVTRTWVAGVECSEPPDANTLGARCARPQPPLSSAELRANLRNEHLVWRQARYRASSFAESLDDFRYRNMQLQGYLTFVRPTVVTATPSVSETTATSL